MSMGGYCWPYVCDGGAEYIGGPYIDGGGAPYICGGDIGIPNKALSKGPKNGVGRDSST